MHESHEPIPVSRKNLLRADSRGPRINKELSYEKVVSQEKVSNVMLRSPVLSATEVLDDFSTHVFKKNGGRKHISVGET